MRLYSKDDEERIRAQTRVREWTRAGLLDSSQGARLETDLRVDVKRTNVFLRVGLALFTANIVGASVVLVVSVLHFTTATPIGVVCCVSALVCIAVAEALVDQLHFYRFGVEEALAVASALLLAIGVAALTTTMQSDRSGELPIVIGLFLGAAGGLGVYRRFGFVYAAVGGMACAAAIPFRLQLSAMTRHSLTAAILAAAVILARSRYLRHRDDYQGDEYALLQAAAWAGLYLTLNLQIAWRGEQIDGSFYWFTYVITWVLPVVGLVLGTREKDRALMNVGLAMALVTLVTNDPYLKWPRHTWDPILLGVFLMGVALTFRRWLSTSPNGQRGGFTAARIVSKDSAMLTLLSAAPVMFQPGVHVTSADSVKPGFDGGRSGGAGGGAAF